MKRRNFLKASALASSSLLVPRFLQGNNFGKGSSSRTGKILVVVQLSGGNDGLNTIVPFEDDRYFQLRPQLSIPKNEVLRVSNELGFNPALEALRGVFEEGLMTVVNNVGYPNPDRSHFRSMDIWHTASDSQEYLSNGWIGRYLDSACGGCPPYHALEMDSALSLAMKGERHSGFAMNNPGQLKRASKNPFLESIASQSHEEENLAYLYKTMIDTQSSADYLLKKSKTHPSKVNYPQTNFAKDLKQTAELITADCDTKIYYVNLTGFDTHANQKGRQGRLLKQYAEAMKAFVKDLQQNNLLDETLIMTFSEFGRRAAQNASGGTDHGTANNVFFIGGQLQRPGFFNAGPNLGNLDKNDLRYEVDFRSIYATILDDWLEADASKILGRSFEGLKIV